MNRDEAIRCLEIAKERFRRGDLEAALKFAQKAKALDSGLDEVHDYVEFVLLTKERSNRSSGAGPSEGPSVPEGEGIRHRRHPAGTSENGAAATANGSATGSRAHAPSAKKEYTVEQAEAVKVVLKMKHDYYKVLDVERTCVEVELKKAYRKKALVLHPDKNGAPGADEAFKIVSKAYQVLSDETLRRRYDQTGADPGSRDSMAGPGGMYAGARFQEELSPEDLFNLFFGQMAGGPGFHTFTTRGPGFQFRVNRPQRRPDQAQDGTFSWGPLLPLLLLLLISILSPLLGGGPSVPAFSLSRSPPHTLPRTTSNHGVNYFVDPRTFPYTTVRDRTEERRLRQFENEVEDFYVRNLQHRCQWEMDRKRAAIQAARGLFSVDQERLQAAQAMRLESCEELRTWSR
ncbi:hypothetical protein DFJ74DRAFT_613585 [Hyaloraphidium curvatum]|nr:hypothetical protein DFJ74DRAFT_613585 [Hyaloraphidium curvatum]